MLKSFCYISTATHLMSEADLSALLLDARNRNAPAGITGMLLYCEGTFMQYVEGPEDAIDGLWLKLGHDRRHYGVVKLFRQPIDARVFDGWSMAFRRASPERFQQFVDRARAPAEVASGEQPAVVEMLRDFWNLNR